MKKLIPALLFTGPALVAAPVTCVTLIDAGRTVVPEPSVVNLLAGLLAIGLALLGRKRG